MDGTTGMIKGALRGWLAGMGIASSKIQIEGRGLSGTSTDPVFEFVRYRSYDGLPYGGFNLMLFSNRWTMDQSAKELAGDVASFLAAL